MSLFFFSYRRGQGSSFYNIDRWEESCISSLFFFAAEGRASLTISSLSCGFISYIEVDHFSFLKEENSPAAH